MELQCVAFLHNLADVWSHRNASRYEGGTRNDAKTVTNDDYRA